MDAFLPLSIALELGTQDQRTHNAQLRKETVKTEMDDVFEKENDVVPVCRFDENCERIILDDGCLNCDFQNQPTDGCGDPQEFQCSHKE